MRKFQLSMFWATVCTVMLVGCKPDIVEPGNASRPAIGQSVSWSERQACRFGQEHSGPIPECGGQPANSPLYLVLPDFGYIPYGAVRWVSGQDYFYCIIEPYSGLYVAESYVWMGNQSATVPMLTSGVPDTTRFQYYCRDDNPPRNPFVMLVPLNLTWACNHAACYALLVTGAPLPDGSFDFATVGWGAGQDYDPNNPPSTPTASLFQVEVCNSPCPNWPADTCVPWQGAPNSCGVPLDTAILSYVNCQTVYLGVPNAANGTSYQCANLEVNITGGAAGPYTYLWSTGATTPSVTVCPTATQTYWVRVTAANGTYATAYFTVHAVDARCGHDNSKFLVCHIPPGNPANPQQICIDGSALPAHIAAFRTPGMNPKLGHDSGCTLGPCNAATPCPR